jgi:hypothetical protein
MVEIYPVFEFLLADRIYCVIAFTKYRMPEKPLVSVHAMYWRQ